MLGKGILLACICLYTARSHPIPDYSETSHSDSGNYLRSANHNMQHDTHSSHDHMDHHPKPQPAVPQKHMDHHPKYHPAVPQKHMDHHPKYHPAVPQKHMDHGKPCMHGGVKYMPGDTVKAPCDKMHHEYHKLQCTKHGSWLEVTSCPKPKPKHVGDVVPPESDKSTMHKEHVGDAVPPHKPKHPQTYKPAPPKHKPEPPKHKPAPPKHKPEPPKHKPEPPKHKPEPPKPKPGPPKLYCDFMPVYMPPEFAQYVFRHGQELDFHCPGRPTEHFKARCDVDGVWKMTLNHCVQPAGHHAPAAPAPGHGDHPHPHPHPPANPGHSQPGPGYQVAPSAAYSHPHPNPAANPGYAQPAVQPHPHPHPPANTGYQQPAVQPHPHPHPPANTGYQQPAVHPHPHPHPPTNMGYQQPAYPAGSHTGAVQG